MIWTKPKGVVMKYARLENWIAIYCALKYKDFIKFLDRDSTL